MRYQAIGAQFKKLLGSLAIKFGFGISLFALSSNANGSQIFEVTSSDQMSLEQLKKQYPKVAAKAMELRKEHWFSPDAFRFKIWHVTNLTNEAQVLKVKNSISFLTRAYTLRSASISSIYEDGSSMKLDFKEPMGQRQIFRRNLGANETITMIFEALRGPLERLEVIEDDSFLSSDESIHLQYIFLGIVISLFLYNLFILTMLREKIYAYYLLVLLCQHIIHRLFTFGLLNDVMEDLSAYLFFLATAGMAYFNSRFICEFLGLKRYSPMFSRMISMVAIFTATSVSFPLIFFSGHVSDPLDLTYYSRYISHWGFGALCLLGLGAMIQAAFIRRKIYGAILLLSWTPIIAAGVYWVLAATKYIPWDFLANHGLTIASALEGLLLSLALAYRHKIVEDEMHRSQAQQARVDAEMALASKIQTSLLAIDRDIDGFDIATSYTPAEKTGGDWIGHYHDAQRGICFIACADVVGHGFPAALVTGVATGSIEVILNQYLNQNTKYDPEEVIRTVFDQVHKSVLRASKSVDCAMTMALLAIDTKSGDLWYGNAAHCPIALINESGVKSLLAKGPILGIEGQNTPFTILRRRLEKKDAILLYTDGLFENEGPQGKTLSRRIFRKHVGTLYKKSSQEILQEILTAASNVWQDAKPEDDTSICIYKWIA